MEYYNNYNNRGFFARNRTKIIIGVVILLVISLAMSFSGGCEDTSTKAAVEAVKAAEEETAERGGNSSSGDTVKEGSEEHVARVTTEAKFMSNVTNPLDDPKVLDASSKMLYGKLDLNSDGKVYGDEIPSNMKGFDLDGDSVLSMEELKAYLKDAS